MFPESSGVTLQIIFSSPTGGKVTSLILKNEHLSVKMENWLNVVKLTHLIYKYCQIEDLIIWNTYTLERELN